MRITHTVFKNEDLYRYLDANEYESIVNAGEKINQGRFKDDRQTDSTYIVVNMDEPYVDEVIEVLKLHNAWEEEAIK